MAKHLEAVKAYDEFRAPWETADGSEAEIDKPKLKRYIYNLVTDKAKAQDARDTAQEQVATVEAERDEFKAQAADANGAEAQKTIDKLEKKVADLTSERDGLVADKERSELRSEVLAGLDPKYAKYVQGETREELEKSLEEVKVDFGLDSGDEDEDEDNEPEVRTTPRARTKRLTNPADEKSGKGGEAEIDFDKVADDILGSGPFG